MELDVDSLVPFVPPPNLPKIPAAVGASGFDESVCLTSLQTCGGVIYPNLVHSDASHYKSYIWNTF